MSSKNKGWQKCPICNGSGTTVVYSQNIPCQTCKGFRIIAVKTGSPPKPINVKEIDEDSAVGLLIDINRILRSHNILKDSPIHKRVDEFLNDNSI